MPIGSVCNTYVVTVSQESTLAEASRIMQSTHVGSLVVTKKWDEKEIPVGMITDRDLALAIDSSSNPRLLRVSQIMQEGPVVVHKEDGIFEATVKMRENGVKRIPVVNDDGSLYGIISADDLLDLMAAELSNVAKIQEVQGARERGVRVPVVSRAHN
jgi:CBS domain-containing protein